MTDHHGGVVHGWAEPQLWTAHQPLQQPLYEPKHAAPGKPLAWLWTSTHTPGDEYPSRWVDWCAREQFRDDAQIHTVLDMAPVSVFTITGVDTLDLFMTRAVPNGHGDIWGIGHTYSVDWTATVEAWGVDALRVTDAGHWETRLGFSMNTYTWDCESTAWVRPPTILSARVLERAHHEHTATGPDPVHCRDH